MERLDAVLFDLDGTLLDSLWGVRRSLEYIRDSHAPSAPVSVDEMLLQVGRPLREVLQLLVPSSSISIDDLVDAYRAHNSHLLPELELFDGIQEMMQELRSHGLLLGIVTSKRRDATFVSVRKHNLEREFDVILTSDDTPRHKPHPEPLLRSFAMLGVSPSAGAYVGDAVFDVRSAHASGCASIAALWGSHQVDALRAERPHHEAAQPADVVHWAQLTLLATNTTRGTASSPN